MKRLIIKRARGEQTCLLSRVSADNTGVIPFILAVLLLVVSFAQADETKLGVWRNAHDYWGSTDKLGHALFYSWTSRELADAIKNKWLGAGISFAIATIGNEGKDALVPWEIYGPIGGDGWSWWDIGADAVGISWSLWFPQIDQSATGPYCARPLKELWPKVETAALIGAGWVGASAAYHSMVDGKPFPNGSGKWKKVTGQQDFSHVLSDFNGEISFIGPWWMNAHLRPYLPLRWRVVWIGTTLVGWEYVNGYLREKDVPFWGAKGFRDADISVGATSLMLVTIYEVLLYPKSVACEPRLSYRLMPTANGLSVQFNW